MNNQGQAPGGQKDDYGDKGTWLDLPEGLSSYTLLTFAKAAAFINKKSGNRIKDKNILEKITDGLRTAYEKATG